MIKGYINKSVNQSSPVQEDRQRVLKYDKKGKEYVCFLPVDYSKLQQSLGDVNDWKLTNLLKAGINPDFPIRTGLSTRLEGHSTIQMFTSELDAIMDDNNNKE